MREKSKQRSSVLKQIARGILIAAKTKRKIFVSVFILMFALYFFLPPLMLSLLRQPADFVSLNPWASKLPAWLFSGDASLSRKLGFLYDFALVWFIASTHD